MILNIDNQKYYRSFNICPIDYKQKFIDDTNRIIDEGYFVEDDDFSPIQTLGNIYEEKTKDIKHWNFLYEKIKKCIKSYTNKNVEYKGSWVNISTHDSNYNFHTHDNDITCVYYLKCKWFAYGTNIENKFIIPAIENSLLIFDATIEHTILNIPKELILKPEDYRYSIVFDFNYKS